MRLWWIKICGVVSRQPEIPVYGLIATILTAVAAWPWLHFHLGAKIGSARNVIGLHGLDIHAQVIVRDVQKTCPG